MGAASSASWRQPGGTNFRPNPRLQSSAAFINSQATNNEEGRRNTNKGNLCIKFDGVVLILHFRPCSLGTSRAVRPRRVRLPQSRDRRGRMRMRSLCQAARLHRSDLAQALGSYLWRPHWRRRASVVARGQSAGGPIHNRRVQEGPARAHPVSLRRSDASMAGARGWRRRGR